MDEPLLTRSDAARRLEVVDGIPHIPIAALEGYQRAS
jgi:hypothetical protein